MRQTKNFNAQGDLTMLRKLVASAVLIAASGAATAGPINYSEGFDDITSLAGSGWVLNDQSTPDPANTGWFQGNDGIFAAESGAANSYIAANFLGAPFGGTISNWLITPTLTLVGDSEISFSTRTANGDFGDNLEVLVSFGGTNLDEFVSLGTLFSSFYPTDWSSITVLSNGFYGDVHLALRYAVDDTSVAGDYIGIDSFNLKGNEAAVPEPGTTAMFAAALAMVFVAMRRRRSQI